ncbi:hypothetical protein MLD38_013428 [Melastoma candidum]|uniref:Uncharacterized protein n=1 Tax=Melastoma candidum TaxID=119954 RepID=A0ACB9RD82_9MYRT|nr:hypothetical protein MLD38_013428 [Melastoma candidum]
MSAMSTRRRATTLFSTSPLLLLLLLLIIFSTATSSSTAARPQTSFPAQFQTREMEREEPGKEKEEWRRVLGEEAAAAHEDYIYTQNLNP